MRIEKCAGVYEPEDDSYLLLGIEEIKGRILEIGCGTGIIGLSYAKSGSVVTLVDISDKATRCARNNAIQSGLSVNVVRTNMFDGIRGKFDWCVFNPPYLPSEAPVDQTWTGGTKGNELTLEFLKKFSEYSDHAFYIESSLSHTEKGQFEGLSFRIVNELDYDFEVLSLVKVTVDARY